MKSKLLLSFVVMLCATVSYAQNISGTWSGELSVGNQKLEIVFHFEEDADGRSVATMDVPAQGAMGILAELKLLSADSVCLGVPSLIMSYMGKLTDGTIEGTFFQRGMSFPLDLKPGVGKPDRPQEPKGPFEYNTFEIGFQNKEADIWLGGTLTHPIGYKEGDRVPVVVMVSGSGAQNRDEELFGHKPFLVIADYLAKNGIASFRYDDRGVGKSLGTQAGCTSEDFAGDAASAIEFLRNTNEFDKIGVMGHSEGGLIAFMLAAEGKADFIVSLAGPGIKGDTLLVEQQNAIYKLKGIPMQSTVKMLREQLSAQSGNVWMEFFLDYDPRADIEKITIPVMAINGSNDLQVIAGSNLKEIERLLAGKNGKNLIKEYPELNHLFQHCTPQTALDYYQIEETISEEVLKDIVEWINGL